MHCPSKGGAKLGKLYNIHCTKWTKHSLHRFPEPRGCFSYSFDCKPSHKVPKTITYSSTEVSLALECILKKIYCHELKEI